MKKIYIAILCTDLLDFKNRVNEFYARDNGTYHGNSAYIVGNIHLFALMYDTTVLRGRKLQAVDITPKAKKEHTELSAVLHKSYMHLTADGLRALKAIQSAGV